MQGAQKILLRFFYNALKLSWEIICEKLSSFRYEEVKSLAPTLYFPKFPFPSLSANLPSIFSLPRPYIFHRFFFCFSTFLFPSLPSFSLPYLPCPFCSSLTPIVVFLSQPSSFPRHLPLSLPTFPFPTFPFPTSPLPYLSSFLPTYLIPYLSTSLSSYPLPSLPFPLLYPSPPIPFFCRYPSPLLSFFPVFLFSFSFPSPFPTFFPFSFLSPFPYPFPFPSSWVFDFFPSPRGGGGEEIYTTLFYYLKPLNLHPFILLSSMYLQTFFVNYNLYKLV